MAQSKFPMYRKDNDIPRYHKIISPQEILTVHNREDYYGVFFFAYDPDRIEIIVNSHEISCVEFSKNLNEVITRAAQEESCPDVKQKG